MDSISLQKQVRDNSEDLLKYVQSLRKWEEDMKRKEDELNDKDVVAEAPLRRNKSAKTKTNKPTNLEKGKSKAKLKPYSAWDKFDVEKELEKIDSPEEPEQVESDHEDVSEEYKTRIREESIYEKERGNQFVKNKKWNEAISCYTHAIACYGKDPVFYANRALCFLKKEDFPSAETDCTSSLQLDPTYVKALQRRAAARIGRKQFLEALGDLSRVLELEPHNNESKNELQKLEKQLGVTKPKVDVKVTPKTAEISIPKQITPVVKSVELPKNKIEIKEHLIPWPERAQSESVLAIRKLPHQRSKKPIKRIEVIESDCNNIDLLEVSDFSKVELNSEKANTSKVTDSKIEQTGQKSPIDRKDVLIEPIETRKCSKDALNASKVADSNIEHIAPKHPKNNSIKLNEPESLKVNAQKLPKDAKDDLTPENKGFKIEQKPELFDINCSPEVNIPETIKLQEIVNNIPKTSVQFYTNWKTMGKDYKLKYLYLRKIDPVELPNIFRDSMECDVFSEIIHVLYTFVKLIPNVHLFVENLSKIKRFSALTMFMSRDDKKALENIFQYCEVDGKLSTENINKLRNKYEL